MVTLRWSVMPIRSTAQCVFRNAVGVLMVGCSALSPLGVAPVNEAPVAVADSFTLPLTPHVTLAWDDPDNSSQAVGGYYLYYWQSDWEAPQRVDVGKQTTYTLFGLEAGQTYTFAVTVHDGHGKRESRYSNVVRRRVPHESTVPELTIETPGVLANDHDRNGDVLKAMLVSRPTHGAVALREDGGFTYTPNKNFSGRDRFTYHVTDGTLTSNVATVTITVQPAAVSQIPLVLSSSAIWTGKDTSKLLSPGSRTDLE